MRRNDGIVWSAALVISLLIHGALFINRTTELSTIPEKRGPENSITRISFLVPAPSMVTPVEMMPELPEPQPVIEKPEPKPKPKPKPEPKPELKSKLKPKPKPVEKVTASREVRQTPTRAPPVSTAEVEKALPVLQPVVDPRLSAQARQSYLTELLSHIESHKHYPRSARRRHIEGVVQVSFRLLPEGQIDGLKVTGKRRVLQQASRNAVVASLPVPSPPEELDLPLAINFSMAFVLK
ncbi:MAG: TonB family protein [Arenicellales bacterium]